MDTQLETFGQQLFDHLNALYARWLSRGLRFDRKAIDSHPRRPSDELLRKNAVNELDQ
jgi:hypothetical protein